MDLFERQGIHPRYFVWENHLKLKDNYRRGTQTPPASAVRATVDTPRGGWGSLRAPGHGFLPQGGAPRLRKGAAQKRGTVCTRVRAFAAAGPRGCGSRTPGPPPARFAGARQDGKGRPPAPRRPLLSASPRPPPPRPNSCINYARRA